MPRVEELARLARSTNDSGHPARGARIVHRALRLLAETERLKPGERDQWAHTKARLLITLAWSEFEVHGLARGQERLREAQAGAEASDGVDVVGLVHDLRGLMLVRSGDLPASLLELDKAVLFLDTLEVHDQAALLLNRGSVHLHRGDLALARSDLTRSAELAARHGIPSVEFKARHNLGYAEFLSGDLPVALEAFARADALDVNVSRSVWFLDRARVLMEAGLLAEAEESLARASARLTIERANQDRAETQLARAQCALLQGDWQLAKAHSSRARRDFRRRQSTAWQSRADVTRWQASLDSKGGPARVSREIRNSIAAAGVDAPTDPEVALIAAEAHLALGHVDQAVAVLARLGPPGRGAPLSARLHRHLVRAGVARAAGEFTHARRELRIGLTTLAEQQARHHSLDLRTAMAVHGGRLAELDLRIALESSSPSSVFDSLERWRAMSHRRTAVTPPSDPELAGLLSQLRIVTEEIRSTPPGSGIDRPGRRQQALERSIREREWRLKDDGRSERSVRLSELRSPLAARHTDVISYYVLDRQLAAVTVSNGRCRVESLAPWSDVAALLARVRADLDALAGRLLPDPLRAAVTSSLRHDLTHLQAALLPSSLSDDAPLVVVPTRNLASVPWGMLPRRRGLPTTVSLSSSRWVRGLQDRGQAQPLVVAMAGPGLPLSGREVLDVAAIWASGTAVESIDSSATSLAAALTSNDLVHIAAHGTHNRDNPLFSSIRLAGGPLFAYDIPQDAQLAEHIVLSACDLGLTTPRPGGEVLGLTAAFLSMGARCVVSSISRVDDTTAYATMRRYHELLAAGVDSAAALGLATDGDLSRPAPFVCFGSTWEASD